MLIRALRCSPCRLFFFLILLLGQATAVTFKNPTFIATSEDPTGLATADFNHDGKLDLVYIDGVSTNAVHVLLGNGDGTFTHGQDLILPPGSGGGSWFGVINLADVNGDGQLDLVLGGAGSSVAQVLVVIGNGDGTFQPPILSVLAANPGGNFPLLDGRIGIGDINGDGAVDLVAADPQNTRLWVALGDGKGKFSLSVTANAGYGFDSYLADLNGDGHLDIVVMDRLGAIATVFLGNGNGTFQTSVSYNTGAGNQNMFLADVDGDGHLDVIANAYPGQINFLKGNSDGTFATLSTIATVATTDLLTPPADFNGDGVQDLVFLTPAGVGVLLGKGGLTYGSKVPSLAGGTSAARLAEGDFNGDGHTDIAMGVEGGIVILIGKGDGSFVSGDLYDMGQVTGTCAVGDFSGDGFPDIAVSLPATYPRILSGNGQGGFTLAQDQNKSYGTQAPISDMAAADFNGDGKRDLVIATSPGSVLLGAGNATFSAPASVSGSTVVGDLNGDGRSDMVAISGTMIASLLGQANGTFTTVSTPLRNPTFTGVAGLADLNNDGKLDVLIYAYTQIEVWLGNGDGSFTYHGGIDISSFLAAQVVAVADLDGDGKADVILAPSSNPASPSGPLVIFYGNGDGTFQTPVLLPISHRYWQVVVADMNRDNKADLVVSDGSGIAVITNEGARSFGNEEHFVAGSSVSKLSVTDINGDGFPDIVAANSGGTTVAVLLNEPNGVPPDGAASFGVLSITPEPSKYIQPFTLSIKMSAPAGGPVPTGSVSYSLDGSFVVTAPLVAGTATYSFVSALAPGTHTFIATYDGDTTYRPESFAVLHVVSPPVYPTKTALVAMPQSVLTSQTVRLTATVTSNPTVPGGFVTFMDGASSLGSAQVDSTGVALLDTALLAAGIHSVTAAFPGFNDRYAPAIYTSSTSSPVTVTVSNNATATAISSSGGGTFGKVVTFTASVTSGSRVPFGGVTFYDSGIPLGTTSVKSDGTSTFSIASLGRGTHSITAVFSANATFGASTSPVLVIAITTAGGGAPPTPVNLSGVSNIPDGNSILTASVGTGSVKGTVVFLDSGNILGNAPVDGSGRAALTAALGSGAHNLSASFTGNSPLAPGVSPELLEQWPASGPGFSLQVGADSLRASQTVSVSVLPLSGFQQKVQLSCADGLPAGYACAFSPTSLNGGGVSWLTIQNSGLAELPSKSRGLQAAALSLFALCFAGVLSRRNSRVFAMFVVISSFVLLAGCGGSSGERSQIQVLSIRATSGSGSSTIVHSAQVRLNIESSQ